MKKILLTILFCLPLFLCAQILPNLGGQRAGISALTFLKIDVSPKVAAMGGATIALSGDAYATQWNPAAIVDVEHQSYAISNTFWVAGVNHAFASGVLKTKKDGAWGISLTSLTSGKMKRRTEFQPDGTGEYFYASNTGVGISYAKKLTERFSYGVTGRYVNEVLDRYSAHTAVVDLGFLYRTDFKDLQFAVVLNNFGINSKLKGSHDSNGFNSKPVSLNGYPPPTLFRMGISMIPYNKNGNQLAVMVQLDHPNDNAENIRLGVEYRYKSFISFRAGYKINVEDQYYPTAGIGLKSRIGRYPLNLDYAVDPLVYLGWIHRIGFTFSINKEEKR